MASPLSTLRRYKFAFFVFFGVVCMLVFVIGDPLDTWLRSRSSNGARSENKVVVTWRGGQMRENEIGYTQSVRNVIREFIRALLAETQKKNGSPRVQPLQFAPSEEDIVYTQLLAQRAEKMGMVISDETALLYLEQLTANLIPRNGIGKIFEETVGAKITEQQLLSEIKTELLAQNFISLTYPDLVQAQLPVDAWEYHRRLNRRVKPEVMPVQVANFKSKVTRQPTGAEIEASYNAGKDRYPDPASPEPGFKRPRKAAFDYVMAERKKFEAEEAAKLKPQVTDQEIQEYYDKNKDEFRIPDETPAKPQTDATKPDGTTPDAAKPADPAAAPPSDTQPEKSQPEKNQPAPNAPKSDANSDAKPDVKPEDKNAEPKAESQPPGDKPAAEKLDEKKDAKPAEPPKQNSDLPDSACGQDQDAATKNEDAKKVEDKSNSPVVPASPAAATPASEDPPAVPPVAPTTNPPAATIPESKHRPLDDKLKEEIREKIAKQKAAQAAQQRIDKGFEEIKRALEKYAREKRSAELSGKPGLPPLDLTKLAGPHGMVANSIPLSDPNKVQETELGKSVGFDFSSMSFEPIPFHVLAYRDGIPLFKPEQIRGSAASGNPDAEFLYWKTKEEDPFVPELKDARDEVVEAWKMREALALAEAEAKALAEKATKGGKPLKEVFADNKQLKVAESNPFTWMTRGFLPANMGGTPTLSSVDNVDYPGHEFMRSVFKLKPGEVGAAANQPRTVVYVVRLESESPPEDVLREQFLQSGNSNELQQIAFLDKMEVRRTWFEALRRELNVKWERDPQS